MTVLQTNRQKNRFPKERTEDTDNTCQRRPTTKHLQFQAGDYPSNIRAVEEIKRGTIY